MKLYDYLLSRIEFSSLYAEVIKYVSFVCLNRSDDATMISMSDFIYRPLKLGNTVKDTFVNFLYNHFKESIKLRLKDE